MCKTGKAAVEYAGTVANLMTHSERRHSLAVRQSAPVSLLHLQLTGAPAMSSYSFKLLL